MQIFRIQKVFENHPKNHFTSLMGMPDHSVRSELKKRMKTEHVLLGDRVENGSTLTNQSKNKIPLNSNIF